LLASTRGTGVTLRLSGRSTVAAPARDRPNAPLGGHLGAGNVKEVARGLIPVQRQDAPGSGDRVGVRIVEFNGNIAQGGNLHTLNNPSPIGGRGGSCFGDSGGPLFANNTNQIVAVVSFGFNGTCHGADYSWRVDTQESYNFILPFLSQ
jgi:hypothetical protein